MAITAADLLNPVSLVHKLKAVSAINPLPIGLPTDGPNFDAFARLRVSNPETIFDSKQIHNNQPLFFDESITGAGSAAVWTQNHASTDMGVAVNTVANVTRQTFRRFNYQAGKSQLIFITGSLSTLGGGTGITRAMGLFDDSNGLFARDNEGVVEFVKRSNYTGTPVDTAAAQADWNIDKFDGTGESGITLDAASSQILFIDFEWLGVGRVRIGWVIDGIPYYCHQFVHANNVAGVYMSTPNLPIRYEITNDGAGAASSMEHICSTVISEGGTTSLGINHSHGNDNTPVVAAVAGTRYALCGIRLQSTNLDGAVLLLAKSVLELNAVDYRWEIIFNPTLAGTAPTFSLPGLNIVEFAVGVAANTVTGGNKIASAYVKGGKETGVSSVALDTTQSLGSAIDGTLDEIWLVATPLSNNADFVGTITWREIS